MDTGGAMAQDQLLIRGWELLLLAFFRSQPLQFSLNWPLISSFLNSRPSSLLHWLYSVCLDICPLSVFLSLLACFFLPVVWPPPSLPLRLLTLLLITKHTGAISADLQPTPVPLSIHPLPSVTISPSLPSVFLCSWSKVALCGTR